VRGATGFRREAWLAGRVAGLEVDGYRPGARDLQILQCRVDGRAHRTTPDRETPESTATERRRGTQPTPRERVRIVEAVVRDGVNDPSVRARIIAAARSRLAGLLERPPPRQSPARTVERNRSR
ncbi:MAG TPA: hypothetical protein VFW13_08050, partial [Phenylobacterium sp.]|nr:hypothetical protein [Phenylobacterium sp.]